MINRKIKNYLKRFKFIVAIVVAIKEQIDKLHGNTIGQIQFIISLSALNNITKQELITDIKNAIENKIPLAIGKMGTSEHQMITYKVFLRGNKNKNIKLDINNMVKSFSDNAGLFPANHDFILKYSDYFVENIKQIDCLGYFKIIQQIELLKYYEFKSKVIFFVNQEPDRSIPNDDSKCYLPYFKDKKMLIICPFGKFLAQRANKETFEKVWAKTGKKWFYPKSVEGLDFPYGLSKSTQEKYGTVFNLIEEIQNNIKKKDFDIALIAAGGIAIPLAAYVKRLGKVSISLGGHLQVLFGVLGERWRSRVDWQEKYINEHWVNLPENYIPDEKDNCEKGCYW